MQKVVCVFFTNNRVETDHMLSTWKLSKVYTCKGERGQLEVDIQGKIAEICNVQLVLFMGLEDIQYLSCLFMGSEELLVLRNW